MLWTEASTYFVDLRPLGFKFQKETTASSPKEAVHNTLYYYLGKDPSKLRLFVYRNIQERGEKGWEKVIEECANELGPEKAVDAYIGEVTEPETVKPEQVPPTSEQLELLSFHKVSDPQHPGAAVATQWKEASHMEFLEIDKLLETLSTVQDAWISVKLDGELVCLYWDGHEAVTVTRRGTIRNKMPITEEANKLFVGKDKTIFLGELYLEDNKGVPIPYVKSAKVLRSDDGQGQDENIRLSVFDVAMIDGKELTDQSLDDKIKQIQSIFGTEMNGDTYIHAAPYVKGGVKEAEQLWDQVEDKKRGYEGLVTRIGGLMYKTKPVQSYHMMVIGVRKSEKIMDRISAILTALIDEEGRYALNATINIGLDDVDRIKLMDYAKEHEIFDDGETIWISPEAGLVVEIAATDIQDKKTPVMEFKNGKLVTVENKMIGILQHPVFQNYIEEEKPSYETVSIDQLPGIESSFKGFQILCSQLEVGKFVKTIGGDVGEILEITNTGGGSEFDIDVIVEWERPLWEVIRVSEIHPSDIIEVGDNPDFVGQYATYDQLKGYNKGEDNAKK